MNLDICNIKPVSTNTVGKLNMIIGPMFSGKTSHLVDTYNKCKLCNIPCIVINHSVDTRYHDKLLSTHDNKMIACIQLTKLHDILSTLDKCEKNTVVLINEGQFFPDLYDTVKTIVDELNLQAYVYGLDGDFKRMPFGQILNLIPLCDSILKLTAFCMNCKNGTHAIFSKRLVVSTEQTLVGTSEAYVPLCRTCFLK